MLSYRIIDLERTQDNTLNFISSNVQDVTLMNSLSDVPLVRSTTEVQTFIPLSDIQNCSPLFEVCM